MFRLIAMLTLILAGTLAGALIGLISGAAALEFGKGACQGTACADAIVKSWAPLGALAGAVLGFIKARSLQHNA